MCLPAYYALTFHLLFVSSHSRFPLLLFFPRSEFHVANPGSFTKPTTEYLTLSNPTSQPLAFKVKTTAPKIYCVRPNASILEPGASVKVSIILQGFSQPLPEDYKCKDKFLLVSVPCTGLSDPLKVGDSWSSLEAKNKLQLVSKKLRVSYAIGKDLGIDSEPAATVHNPVSKSAENGIDNGLSNNGHGNNAHGSSAGGASGIAGGLAAGAAATAGAVGAAVGLKKDDHALDRNLQSQNQSQNQNQYQNQNQNHDAGRNQSYNSGSYNSGSYNSGGSGGSGGYGKVEGYPSAGDFARQQPQGDLQRELEASNARISKLAEKLDALEGSGSRTKLAHADPVQGVSLPVAILLVIIAFLVGWLLF